MRKYKTNFFKTTLIVILFTASTVFPIFLMNFNAIFPNQNSTSNYSNINNENNIVPITSDVSQIDSTLSSGGYWWNETWSKRVGIKIENDLDFDRHEPVDIYLTFEANSFYKGTERLILYYGSGVWSDPIPIQLYNTTGTTYYTSFNLVFIANVTKLSNSTYFLYYHVSGSGIDTSYSYNTGFQSTNIGGSLTVEVKREDLTPDVNDYKLVLKEGEAVSTLVKGTGSGWSAANYHTNVSLAPERIETIAPHVNLEFSAHLDETGTGTSVTAYDYNGVYSILGTASTPINNLATTGITNGAFDFDSAQNEIVTFPSALEASGEPFNTNTQKWSMACWINPTTLTTATTKKGTPNPFIAQADGNKANFEIGIDTTGHIVMYLNTETDALYTFTHTTTINTGSWYFIAVRVNLAGTYPTGDVGVCVNNEWQYTSAWDTAGNSMGGETSRTLAIGGSTGNTPGFNYFDGIIDEVQFYSSDLTETLLDTTYKYSSHSSEVHSATINSIQDIEVGDVFSRYAIDWTPVGNMYADDIVTFYWDYNLWSIQRTIYFTIEYDDTGYGVSSGPMVPLNSYYDVSQVNSAGSYYISDEAYAYGLTNTAGLQQTTNFTIIYCEPNTNDDAFGIYVQDWNLINGATMSYFNGTVTYDSEIVQMSPGVNNDFSNSPDNFISKKLTVNFWEFIDSVFFADYGSDPDQIVNYFTNVSISLKGAMNQYIYNPESLTYDIAVYVTDHDNNVVPSVNIELLDENGTLVENNPTDSSGYTIFQSIVNGSYTVNASYTDFGRTIEIADPIPIDDLAAESNQENLLIINFTQVNMTSILLNCSKIIDGQWTSALNNARFNFTYSSNGIDVEQLTGYKYANTSGAIRFRWKNASLAGYVIISIYWLVDWENFLQAENDRDINPATLTLYFNNYTFYEVNATEAGGTPVTYTTSIVLYDVYYNYLTDINVDLDDSFTIIVNYSYSGSDGSSGPIIGDVNMDLKISGALINVNPISFTHNGSGIYNLTMDTSDPIEAGGQAWKAGVDYVAEINGDDGTVNDTLVINLKQYTTRISTNETYTSSNWFEMINFDITYEYNNSGVWTGINGATLSYYIVGYGEIFGTSLPSVGVGTYRLSLNTMTLPETGSYFVHITATKQNYQTLGKDQRVVILDISTKLNNSEITYQYEADVYLGETEVFYLQYTEAISGSGISGAETAQFDWWEFINNIKVDEGTSVALNDEGNGIYSLDFNTASLEVGNYIFEVLIKKSNYELARATIDLNINKRDFSTTALTFYTAVSGDPEGYKITICLKDALTNTPITDISPGMMNITFLGKTFNFNHIGSGCYAVILTNIPGDALITPQLYDAVIRISRENYTTFEDTITINVGLIEVFGVPLFYLLIIIIGTIVVIGALVTYRVIQVRRIPKFIKKSKALIKAISSEDKISDSLMYPSKEAFIAKKFEDNWKIHNLSLSDIMGIGKGKKAKNLPEDKLMDAKGGGA